jgi:hypothetical protein
MRGRSTKIEVQQTGRDEPMIFSVLVADSAGSTRHRVTLSKETYENLTKGRVAPLQCVEAAFRFLLERESKSDLLTSFDINVIKLSFPSFEREFPNYL